MTIEGAIWARVASLAPVVAIVGARVYLEKLPQHPEYPAVLVQLVSDTSAQHLRGPIGATWARVQVDALVAEGDGADAQAQASALAAAIHGDGRGPAATGLQGFRGAIGSPAVTIKGCFRENRVRQYDADERRVVHMQQDYRVCYRVAA